MDAVRGADIEVLAGGMREGEGGIRLANKVRSKFAPNRMEVPRRNKPTRHGRQQRRQEQKDQHDANQASAQGRFPLDDELGRACYKELRIERASCSRLQAIGTGGQHRDDGGLHETGKVPGAPRLKSVLRD